MRLPRLPLVLALPLLLATAPLAAGAAAEPCAPARADRYEPLAALPGLPPGWQPLLGLDESRLPPVPTVAALGPGGLCDLTADPAAFARAAGLTSPGDRARLAVAVAWPDQLGVPEVRDLAVSGGAAAATTWSARDGVVADWVVDLAAMRADFVVRAVGAGDFAAPEHGFEGWHVWPGLSSEALRAQQAGALATKVKLQPLPDGKQFRLTYFTQFYSSEAQADAYAAAYAAASLAVWTIQNQQWGFASSDPDGTYDITMDGCSCIFAGHNVNIHVHAKLEGLYNLFNPPLSYPTPDHFYRIVIGHEWHHHLQYAIFQWKVGWSLVEGGARFSETIFEPEGAHGPRTIQYLPNANGFSNMMLRPGNTFSSRLYDLGLMWGYLYSQEGGLRFLKAVYAHAADESGNANQVLGAVIQQALTQLNQEAPGSTRHLLFQEALADFSAAMHAKSFPWAPPSGGPARDWGLYLPAAVRVPAQALGGGAYSGDASVGPGAVALVKFPDGAAFAGAGGNVGGGHRWAFSMGGAAQASAAPVLAVAGATDVVFAVSNPGAPVWPPRQLPQGLGLDSDASGLATAAVR